MKNRIKTSAIASLMLFSVAAYSQSDSLGLPGDNLDLNAVLSIFKQSSNVEDFEKRLNSADPKINNLDLNNDGQVDYLRVVDYGKDDFHSIVIQDPVSKTESQDVAVVEIVKKGDNTAHLQIVGDETLYGKNYIIEPTDGTQTAQAKTSGSTSSKGYDDDVYNNNNSNSNVQSSGSQVMVNVYAWPSVGYLYTPGYSYWSSPYYWGYYPGWYSPWSPYGGWYAYHRSFVGWNYGFYGYRTNYYAFPRAHNYYYGHRMASGYVQKNTTYTYGRRGAGSYNGGTRAGREQRSSGGGGNQRVNNNGGARNNNNAARNNGSETRVRNNAGVGQSQSNQQRSAQPAQSNPTRVQGNQGTRVQSGGGGQRVGGNPGGGARMGGGGGGARMGGGGGGARMGGGGGGGRVSGGGGRR